MTAKLSFARTTVFARRSGIAGLGLYFFLTAIVGNRFGDSPETRLIHAILLLAVLVIIPLGLSLIPLDETDNHAIFRVAVILQPVGAAAVFISFILGQGILPAAFALVWLLVTGLGALFGLTRLLRRELRSASEISISAGLIFLPIGAVWLLTSRLGIQPLGFGDTIVLLTAVHFHFAGFAAPVLAGLAGRRLPEGTKLQRVHRLAVVCIITGTPLVAAGITFSPVMALVGASIISTGLIVLAIIVCGWVVPAIRYRSAQALLVVSSAALLPAMLLASTYAYSIVFNKLIVDIPQMAMTHGIANAFGFALCGMIAWTIVDSAKTSAIH
ncbi:MAG: YndJ family protein [Acidobacteriota bacterium]